MPYKKYHWKGSWYAKNLKTGKVTRYNSKETMETGIRVREAYAHGWKPTGLAKADQHTRQRVSSMGGKARSRR